LIRWIQKQAWIPEIALSVFLLLAGLLPDTLIQGWQGAVAALGFALAPIFLRNFQYLAIALILIAGILEFVFRLSPLLTGVLTFFIVLFAAAFSQLKWAIAVASAVTAVGVAVVLNASFNSPMVSKTFGIAIITNDAKWLTSFAATIINLIVIGFAWLLGTWLITQYSERKLRRERTAVNDKQVRLAIDLAEQNERMGIARDLNLVTTAQLSSSIALLEGARYASKIDPEVAKRTLERVEGILREAHTELQQQQDALGHGVSIAPAPPNIFDLDALMVQYREMGYNCTLKHEGEIVSLIDSAELNIYRIVFDALANIREHTPVGTTVTVDLTWQSGGLQVLIKDNGVETARKAAAQDAAGTYNANDDLKALVAEVDGVGIRTMRERAEIIGGSLEAKVVPGVGFTVNAMFPDLRQVIKA